MNQSETEPRVTLRPINVYFIKQVVQIFLIWGIITVFVLGLMTIIGVDEISETASGSFPPSWFFLVLTWYFILSVLILSLVIILTYFYAKTMLFEIWGHEVVVRKGIFNRTERHVPYRTVTNISTRVGLFDRFFGIGTVEVETAGQNRQGMGPEEKIEGIPNYVMMRDLILDELRKFRGQYTTTTEVEVPQPSSSDDVGQAILAELREIKILLSQK